MIFRKIEQDNGTFTGKKKEKKKQKKLEKLPFFSTSHKMTYIARYLLSTHGEYCALSDHILTLSQCVE